jgi:hypothetical protein
MSDAVPTEPGPDAPPATGDPVIDRALGDLGTLATDPLDQHHDRLTRAHEVLQGSLDRSDQTGLS